MSLKPLFTKQKQAACSRWDITAGCKRCVQVIRPSTVITVCWQSEPWYCVNLRWDQHVGQTAEKKPNNYTNMSGMTSEIKTWENKDKHCDHWWRDLHERRSENAAESVQRKRWRQNKEWESKRVRREAEGGAGKEALLLLLPVHEHGWPRLIKCDTMGLSSYYLFLYIICISILFHSLYLTLCKVVSSFCPPPS